MDRIVKAIDDGTATVDNSPLGRVPYLVFELAEGDVRHHLNQLTAVDVAWRLRSLHQVATGLRQLHHGGIAHQDLKPSNVLIFDKDSKLSDLGRAAHRETAGPCDELAFAGDMSYAPPELRYGQIDPDWSRRRFGADFYLLGNLTVFFFTQLSVNMLVNRHLPADMAPSFWGDPYSKVLPYLAHAFSLALDDFASQIGYDEIREDLRLTVYELCQQDPSKRAMPKGVTEPGSRQALERYISKFNILARTAELKLR
jgi:serine/threonine protein kinase